MNHIGHTEAERMGKSVSIWNVNTRFSHNVVRSADQVPKMRIYNLYNGFANRTEPYRTHDRHIVLIGHQKSHSNWGTNQI